MWKQAMTNFPLITSLYGLSTNNMKKKLLPYRKMGMAAQHKTFCP